MFKITVVIIAIIVCVAAKPGLIGAPWAYTAHAAVVAVPAPFITATSSQVIARNYNGIATAPVVAPAVIDVPIVGKTLASPIAAAPIVAHRTPIFGRTLTVGPLSYAAAPALW